jgi:hypothetical protein
LLAESLRAANVTAVLKLHVRRLGDQQSLPSVESSEKLIAL